MIRKVNGEFFRTVERVKKESREFSSTWDRIFGNPWKEVPKYSFASEGRRTGPVFSAEEYARLLKWQRIEPQPLMRSDKYVWWMFRDEFFRADDDLTALEVKALLYERLDKKERRIKKALANLAAGATPLEPPYAKREPIPEDVRVYVWRRDGGRCVKCGSQENLEFDHIIPLSKGGSNTARNIQLLCAKCNREKGADVA